jgi:thiamine biosynthesis lipoprotein
VINIHRYAQKASRVERMQPHLGTFVRIAIEASNESHAYAAADAGFAAVAEVHRLMSFHEAGSDVSCLNRLAAQREVKVDARTFEVIRLALEISDASEGLFDITVAPQLVAAGLLPQPADAPEPDPRATWRDIELTAPDCIRFKRAVWIDLGGIAKGFAVDHAIERMQLTPQTQCHVNAGGDLRVEGPNSEQVLLRVPGHDENTVPAIDLASGSLASSSRLTTAQQTDAFRGPHIHGIHRRHIAVDEFAAVLAERCVIADALTKVALAAGPDSASVLSRFDATAFTYDPRNGWQRFGYDS